MTVPQALLKMLSPFWFNHMFNYFLVTKAVLRYGMAMLAVGVSVSANCPSFCNGPSSVNSDRKEVSVDTRIMM